MGRLIEDMLDLARARVGGGIAIKAEESDLDALIGPLFASIRLRPLGDASRWSATGCTRRTRYAQRENALEDRHETRDLAKADKIARTGSADEKVRDTPPAGAWNDTSHD